MKAKKHKQSLGSTHVLTRYKNKARESRYLEEHLIPYLKAWLAQLEQRLRELKKPEQEE